MFHVKLLPLVGEVAAAGVIVAQVATGQPTGPTGTTVVVGLLAIVIAMQWQTGRKVAAIEERLKPLASREWTIERIRQAQEGP